tara:strand:- start:1429 stop:1620 length:192 start_codon:yes stop_codon:yes gene_type:complete
MNLHLSKEEFNKEIQRLHNRINYLSKHIVRQDKKIEELKITIRLVKNKYKNSNIISNETQGTN